MDPIEDTLSTLRKTHLGLFVGSVALLVAAFPGPDYNASIDQTRLLREFLDDGQAQLPYFVLEDGPPEEGAIGLCFQRARSFRPHHPPERSPRGPLPVLFQNSGEHESVSLQGFVWPQTHHSRSTWRVLEPFSGAWASEAFGGRSRTTPFDSRFLDLRHTLSA